MYQAHGLKWTCVDIFITLRYVDNFFAGHGLVYNAGEYVEGYTHFLWLVLLLLCKWMGFDPVSASQSLGLLSFAGVVLVFSAISYKLFRRALAFFLPLTPLVLSLHRDFLIWATSGLETMFFTFVLSLAFYFYFFTEIERRAKVTLTGLLLILAVLTRPDGALIFLLANVFLAARAILFRSRPRSALVELGLFNLAFIVIYLPYFVWKVGYYGHVFPNSYYAKSAGLSFYSRGFLYLWLYFRAYVTSGLFLLSIPALAVAGARRSDGPGSGLRGILSEPRYSGMAFALVGVLVYGVLFVARVGGDFMYGRFVVPLLPFMIFLIESSLVDFLRGRKRLLAAVFMALAVVVGVGEKALRDGLLLKTKDGEVVPATHKGIIDERHYYKHASNFELEKEFGILAEKKFRGLDVTVVLKGQAALGYYGKFKTCIENYGLTDEYIAHLPLESRSRVGHEKDAPYEYLIERGTDFLFGRKQYKRNKYREVTFRLPTVIMEGELLTYDRELIRTLSDRFGKAMEFMDFDSLLDLHIQKRLPRLDYEELKEEYEDFREFYFMHNDDKEREAVFLEALRRRAQGDPDGGVVRD